METIWKTPLLGTPLLRNDIHIWQAALDLPIKNIQMFKETLSIDEMKRAKRFHFDKDRNRFIVRRGILRTILGRYINVEPNLLHFCYGKNGKPALSDTYEECGIHFNLSHSEGIALYAFTRDNEIGVDIERIRDFPEIGHITEKFFSERENDVFSALPESMKKEAFTNCWIRKEAFLKAVGEGLSYPLDQFEVSLVPGEPAQLLYIEGDSKEVFRWSIKELKPATGFAAAFAIAKHNWRLHCWHWLN